VDFQKKEQQAKKKILLERNGRKGGFRISCLMGVDLLTGFYEESRGGRGRENIKCRKRNWGMKENAIAEV